MSGIEKGREAVCQPLQRQRGEEARRVLRETPSLTPGIADAIVMKDRNLFFLCGPDGAVPLKNVAFEHRLRLVRPVLPQLICWVEFHRVPVAQSRVDLRFERTASGVAVEVLGKSGRVDVVVEL